MLAGDFSSGLSLEDVVWCVFQCEFWRFVSWDMSLDEFFWGGLSRHFRGRFGRCLWG